MGVYNSLYVLKPVNRASAGGLGASSKKRASPVRKKVLVTVMRTNETADKSLTELVADELPRVAARLSKEESNKVKNSRVRRKALNSKARKKKRNAKAREKSRKLQLQYAQQQRERAKSREERYQRWKTARSSEEVRLLIGDMNDAKIMSVKSIEIISPRNRHWWVLCLRVNGQRFTVKELLSIGFLDSKWKQYSGELEKECCSEGWRRIVDELIKPNRLCASSQDEMHQE